MHVGKASSRRIVRSLTQMKSTSTGIPNAVAASSNIRMIVSGVIFDMDGTLTEEHAINFKAMYDRIGITKRGSDIITQVKEDLDGALQQRAFDIIVDEEMRGCERMVIKDDLNHCIDFLSDNDIKMAISTRNCGKAYDVFADKASFSPDTFKPVLHRDSLNGVNKPDPAVAYHIMHQWGGASPEEVWFVGDSIDDIKCGKSAGCRTCLITTSDRSFDDEHLIDHRVTTLREFVDILKQYT